VAPKEEAIFIHPNALVDSKQIGSRTRIWAFAHVMAGARIGSGCNIGEHCFIENDVRIGDSVVVKNGISIWDGVTVEDGAFLGPHMIFTNDLEPRSGYPKPLVRTRVKKGATIGAGAIIVCGVTIGSYATVGAGSVVTRDVPDHALVFGNPAKQKGWMCICGRVLHLKNDAAHCECGKTGIKKNGSLKFSGSDT